MTKRGKTITVIALVFVLIMVLFAGYQVIFEKREAEIRSRLSWQEPNDQVEGELKDYIDNIDWAYYTNQVIEGLKNPAVTSEDLLNYYGVPEK